MRTDFTCTATRTSLRLGSICALSMLLGCAAAPAGPRGPLMGPGVEIATDMSYAYGRGDLTTPDGTRATGSADDLGNPLTIFPRRLEGRVSPVEWMDVGGQLGWLDGGLDLRLGLPAQPGRFIAFALAAGYDWGSGGVVPDTDLTRSKWIRLEAYPSLDRRAGRAWLVIAAGLDSGTFYHEVADPNPPDSPEGNYRQSAFSLIRQETRLETSIGVFGTTGARKGGGGSFLFSVTPYFVLDGGPPEVTCAGCTAEASAYRQSWGIVAVARFALRYGL